jgi:hypothetical protein
MNQVEEKSCETCEHYAPDDQNDICIKCWNKDDKYHFYKPKGGAKFDKGKDKWSQAPWKLFQQIVRSKTEDPKLRWDLVPFEPLLKIAKIMTHGAEKYAPNNWKTVDPERYVDALCRHLVADILGEVYDGDSGNLHYDHMLCNAVFLDYLKEKSEGK